MSDSNGWRPIETAPKDGREILATQQGIRYIVRWDADFGCWLLDDGCSVLHDDATIYWQPLPSPPAEDAR